MSAETNKPRVGISTCLLGQAVRYDGAHKFSPLCAELVRLVDFVPTCPELGAGLGVPRPPIRLVGDARAPRALRVDDPRVDVTQALQDFAAARLPELQNLCGYVFIQNSPSCGLHGVKLYDEDGNLKEQGSRGLFAAALTTAWPWLPVVEECALYDEELREHFLTRVFVVRDWRELCQSGLTARKLIDFHSRYKYTLMAHDPGRYSKLGQLLADLGNDDPSELGERYFAALMRLLQRPATRRSNTNVLMHLQGYLKQHLSSAEKERLSRVIDDYRRGKVELAVPVALLRQHFAEHPNDYVAQQTFLQPRDFRVSTREP